MEGKSLEMLAFSRSLVREMMMMMMICLMMTITKEQKQLMRIAEETDILLDKGKCLKDMEQ